MSRILILLLAVSMPLLTIAQDSKKSKSKEKIQLVKLKTRHGDMTLMLFNETPAHRDNFVKLAGEGFFDGLLFHRVINSFMIQGGDPGSRDAAPGVQLGTGGPGYTVPAEFNADFIHRKGALAAARQPDQVNPKKASSGSQFYIVQGRKFTPLPKRDPAYTDEQKKIYEQYGGYPPLDMGYTVFGQVVQGMDVIDKIAGEPVNAANRPNEDVDMHMEVLKPMKLKKFKKQYGSW
jgi:peptidyl-prolyl cis-trans isomerase B (cyclophilin B)